MDWLNNFIFPAEAKNVNPHLAYWGSMLACAEMIKSGTTTFCDMYIFEEETARAATKEGMKYGEIAFKLNPSGIEGWYWYGLCVGTYSDCVSIVKALAEGLKGKTQMGFENAYKTDKMYDDGGPILALGRFWQVLPGIAGQDRKKAEQLFNEYIDLFGSKPDPSASVWYYRGQLYKDTNRTAEAKADLRKAADMGDKDAAALLATMK
jgi:tetratricopeptide (TPR) repeat protein